MGSLTFTLILKAQVVIQNILTSSDKRNKIDVAFQFFSSQIDLLHLATYIPLLKNTSSMTIEMRLRFFNKNCCRQALFELYGNVLILDCETAEKADPF